MVSPTEEHCNLRKMPGRRIMLSRGMNTWCSRQSRHGRINRLLEKRAIMVSIFAEALRASYPSCAYILFYFISN